MAPPIPRLRHRRTTRTPRESAREAVESVEPSSTTTASSSQGRCAAASRSGALDAKATHLAILGGTLCAVGLEIVFSSFFLSILKASRTGRWV